MIRISKKADYAILLLTHLARHANRGDDGIPTSAQELSNAIPIGKATIANLLKVLTRHSVLESVRGVHGGYRLARPAAKISLADIIHAVDGPVAIVDCAAYENVEDAKCELSSCCSSHHPLQILQNRLNALLEGLTLAEFGNSCPVPMLIQPPSHS
ncbi:MAG: Rrf2 family transcriptional regulator [Planctomycetes bacterium]|nr:Rrf2 family transcriptional regulator [Planctomycetota bacterium]